MTGGPAVGVIPTPKAIEGTATPIYILNASNRCDACGHRAYVEAWLNENQSFLFCGHHWHTHGEKRVWFDINDETEALNQKLDASA